LKIVLKFQKQTRKSYILPQIPPYMIYPDFLIGQSLSANLHQAYLLSSRERDREGEGEGEAEGEGEEGGRETEREREL
jgi:hypothetical protein